MRKHRVREHRVLLSKFSISQHGIEGFQHPEIYNRIKTAMILIKCIYFSFRTVTLVFIFNAKMKQRFLHWRNKLWQKNEGLQRETVTVTDTQDKIMSVGWLLYTQHPHKCCNLIMNTAPWRCGAHASCSTLQERARQACGQQIPRRPGSGEQPWPPSSRRKSEYHHTERKYPPELELPAQEKDPGLPGGPAGLRPQEKGVRPGKGTRAPTCTDLLGRNLLCLHFCPCLCSILED